MDARPTLITAGSETIVRWQPTANPLPCATAQEAFREALSLLNVLFVELRLVPHCETVGHAISYDLGHDSTLDISIRNPAEVAYVTSWAGYQYDKTVAQLTEDLLMPPDTRAQAGFQEVKATVKFLGEVMQGEEVFQVTISRRGHTEMPVYVELPPGVANPVPFLVRAVLGVIRMLASYTPEARQAF
jgi:hypothetical protein